MNTFYRVLISAPNLEEARSLQQTLVGERLLAGGLISSGESSYWWENQLTRNTYFNISAFTREDLAEKIMARVKELHSDEVPIVAFFKIELGNPDFLSWINQNTQKQES